MEGPGVGVGGELLDCEGAVGVFGVRVEGVEEVDAVEGCGVEGGLVGGVGEG